MSVMKVTRRKTKIKGDEIVCPTDRKKTCQCCARGQVCILSSFQWWFSDRLSYNCSQPCPGGAAAQCVGRREVHRKGKRKYCMIECWIVTWKIRRNNLLQEICRYFSGENHKRSEWEGEVGVLKPAEPALNCTFSRWVVFRVKGQGADSLARFDSTRARQGSCVNDHSLSSNYF